MTAVPDPPDWASLESISETKLDSISTVLDFLLTPPMAKMNRATSNQSVSDSTNTAVQWNAETFDTAGGHDTVTNNTRYTAGYDGRYDIRATIPWVNVAIAHKVAIWFRRSDGVEYAPVESVKTSSDVTVSVHTSTFMDLTTGQYVEVYVWQNSGSTRTIDRSQHGGPQFDVKWASTF